LSLCDHAIVILLACLCKYSCAGVRESHQESWAPPHRNRFEGGSFYLGVRGKGVGRGGVFTASTEESAEALMSWLDSRASQGDDAAARYLLSNRDIFYDNVYSAEMASVGAEPVSQGLWLTNTPLPRRILAAMGSMRCNTTTRHTKQCYTMPCRTTLHHILITIAVQLAESQHSAARCAATQCTTIHSSEQSIVIHAMKPCLQTIHSPLTIGTLGFPYRAAISTLACLTQNHLGMRQGRGPTPHANLRQRGVPTLRGSADWTPPRCWLVHRA
jgi:hypothetical protein